MQSFIKSESVAHAHQGDARSAAEIRQHLTHKLMQFRFVNHRFLPEIAARLPDAPG
jgi:hypothetical protein